MFTVYIQFYGALIEMETEYFHDIPIWYVSLTVIFSGDITIVDCSSSSTIL